jgi:hypothetical protein
MPESSKGFSLAELLAALMITLTISTTVFELFHSNERIFRDQNMVIEMVQTARVVASQLADELRMAGQGVPLYASTFDSADNESVAVFLSSSTSSRVDFRAGLSNAETYATSSVPLDCTLGTPLVLTVGDGSLFSSALGTPSPRGRFIYVWGPTNNSMWTWVRAELTNVSANSLTLTPWQGGDGGRSAGSDSILGSGDDVIRFTKPPTVSLEEVVSFYLSGTTIKRATATNVTNQISPTWSAANEIGRNLRFLSFIYYDRYSNVVIPSSLANRRSVARVDVRIVAETTGILSNGSISIYPLSFRTIPRNLSVR